MKSNTLEECGDIYMYYCFKTNNACYRHNAYCKQVPVLGIHNFRNGSKIAINCEMKRSVIWM